ncbi:MAG TPA: FAD-dependent oxidoreductase, partial [Solirubrobacteraceae bacterium]|nr:FAD-dependent oxidoreductase [Solirubrobacteraceae bacterium]
GGGMAGLATVESVLEHDPAAYAITIAAAEPDAPYDRVRLSQALRGGATDLVLRPAAWFADRGVELRTSAPVVRLDVAARGAVLADGDEVGYDRMVLATGSRAFLPPIEGLGRDGVHAFRTLRDARAILAAAARGGRAVVIGGGLLGLEAEGGLRARGLDVTVVHLADRLMERQLDPAAARMLQRRLASLGVAVRLGATARAVAGNGRCEAVVLEGGEELAADVVVVAAGVVPDVALARDAGLEVARGILVDDELRASAPGVWAVGECAEHRGVVPGLWAPVARQARAAGAVLAGRPAAFHGVTPATTLKVAGIDLFCAGAAEASVDEEEVLALDSRAGRYRKLVLSGDRLAGAILLGDLGDAATVHELLETGRPVPPELLDAPEPAPAGAPRSQLVCSCNAVSRDTIERAIADGGLERLEQVALATRATTGCGGCRDEVEVLLAGAIERRSEPLRPAPAARPR